MKHSDASIVVMENSYQREKKVQMHFIFMNTDISVREINGKRKVRWSDT